MHINGFWFEKPSDSALLWMYDNVYDTSLKYGTILRSCTIIRYSSILFKVPNCIFLCDTEKYAGPVSSINEAVETPGLKTCNTSR